VSHKDSMVFISVTPASGSKIREMPRWASPQNSNAFINERQWEREKERALRLEIGVPG